MAAQQDQIVNNAPAFASDDELGQYIEGGVHGCMHMAAAEVYGEPDLASPSTAADSTYFYQLHGLIDAWWQQWQLAQPAGQGAEKAINVL
jgi:hypothetical protein